MLRYHPQQLPNVELQEACVLLECLPEPQGEPVEEEEEPEVDWGVLEHSLASLDEPQHPPPPQLPPIDWALVAGLAMPQQRRQQQ